MSITAVGRAQVGIALLQSRNRDPFPLRVCALVVSSWPALQTLSSEELSRFAHVMSLSSFPKPISRILDVTNIVRQGLFRPEICRTSRRYQIANMSAASGDSGAAEKKVEIVWDGKQKLFRTPDGKAYLSYTVRPSGSLAEKKPDVLDLEHTFVPGSFRGQGVAGRLCVAAFEHAKDNGLLVQPTCSYISDTFLPRHPEWNDLVVKNGTKSGL